MTTSSRPRKADNRDEGRRKYFDPRFGKTSVRVLPGEHYVTTDPEEMIVTVLGSCISACIRDPIARVGGMNHFMLPESDTGEWGQAGAAMRYGNYAMEVLINDLMRFGARRERLEIKLFGGGHIGRMVSDVGDRNASFVMRYLKGEGLHAVAVDLGGDHARRIHYFPATGKVKRLLLKKTEGSEIRTSEEKYRTTLVKQDTSGDIELFD